jgi:hypothetical protein
MSHLTHFAIQVCNHADNVLAGRNCPWPLGPNERAVLQTVRGRVGKSNAISLTELGFLTQIDDRQVKAAVSDLRKNFKIQLGASRGTPGGYYLIATAAEARESAHYIVQQATSMLAVARVLLGRQAMADLYGQLEIKLELTDPTPQENVHAA